MTSNSSRYSNSNLTRRCQWHHWVKKISLGNPCFLTFATKALSSIVHPCLDLVWLFLLRKWEPVKVHKIILRCLYWLTGVNGTGEFWLGGVSVTAQFWLSGVSASRHCQILTQRCRQNHRVRLNGVIDTVPPVSHQRFKTQKLREFATVFISMLGWELVVKRDMFDDKKNSSKISWGPHFKAGPSKKTFWIK
jgi:hypothetical protein